MPANESGEQLAVANVQDEQIAPPISQTLEVVDLSPRTRSRVRMTAVLAGLYVR